jgi:hypothetical protein
LPLIGGERKYTALSENKHLYQVELIIQDYNQVQGGESKQQVKSRGRGHAP